MTLLVLFHSALTLVRLGGCALLLSKAGPILHGPRLGRALERTTGLALIGFGLVGTAASGRVGRPVARRHQPRLPEQRLGAPAPYPPRTHGAWVNKWVDKG